MSSIIVVRASILVQSGKLLSIAILIGRKEIVKYYRLFHVRSGYTHKGNIRTGSIYKLCHIIQGTIFILPSAIHLRFQVKQTHVY